MPSSGTRPLHILSPGRQRGVALIFSMVFLLILTLITVTAMRHSILEERMAGNTVDHNRAFQAAEAALMDAERYLQSATLDPFTDVHGRYKLNADNRPAWVPGITSESNEDGGFITYGLDRPGAGDQASAILGLALQPEYIIESFPPVPAPGGSLESGVPLSDLERFRVTARGFGGSESTVVILQSTYQR